MTFVGGMIGVQSGAKVITLNDTVGVDSLKVNDSEGFTVFKVDSKGNNYLKGKGGLRI